MNSNLHFIASVMRLGLKDSQTRLIKMRSHCKVSTIKLQLVFHGAVVSTILDMCLEMDTSQPKIYGGEIYVGFSTHMPEKPQAGFQYTEVTVGKLIKTSFSVLYVHISRTTFNTHGM